MEMALSWAAVSAAAVACWWLKLHYHKHDHGRAMDLDEMKAGVDEMQADVRSMCADVGDQLEQLHERVDFAERLLMTNKPRQLHADEEVATPI